METGFIDWYEFSPVKDYMLVQVVPDETEKKTETGIVLSVQESVIEDRPKQGVIKAVGPDAPYKIGTFVYWTKNGGYDLKHIRVDENDSYYILINPDTVLGIKVKDTRK
jgi:co-chaperonin GroES (HSP10)